MNGIQLSLLLCFSLFVIVSKGTFIAGLSACRSPARVSKYRQVGMTQLINRAKSWWPSGGFKQKHWQWRRGEGRTYRPYYGWQPVTTENVK